MLERYGDCSTFLDQAEDISDAFRLLRQSETTGRPLGADGWVERLEVLAGRQLKTQKRGPKRKMVEDN